MNKSTFPTLANPLTQISNETYAVPSSVKRVIVLIPDSYFDSGVLAERIWKLSLPNYSRILLLGLCSDPSTHLMLRRQLALVASSIRNKDLPVDIALETGKHWSKKVEQIWKSGDTVVGLTRKSGGWYRREMNELFRSTLQIPIQEISDIQVDLFENRSILSEAILWLGAIGIMAFFFWIQITIDHLPANWGQSVLLYLSVLFEIAILWAWNLLLE